MSPSRWTRALLGHIAAPARADEILGDLEEAHRERVRRRGRLLAGVLTSFEALELALAILRQRRRRRGAGEGPVPPRLPGVSLLDFKLGLRMLVRYPGLTVVGVLAMSFGIAIGAGSFQFLTDAAFPRLPYPGADDIVRVRNVNAREGEAHGLGVHDFARLRGELRTLDGLTAYYMLERNLSMGSDAGAPVRAAAITAAGFELSDVPPGLGRPLLTADEAPGAPPVAVLAYDLWQGRFGGDAEVVGRVVRLGGAPTTVVGVMPRGFELPASQDLWISFPVDALAYPLGEGPGMVILGRIAPGASLEDVQSELDLASARAAAAWPETHRDLTLRARPYPPPALVAPTDVLAMGALALMMLALVALMALMCANVALLLFARAAAREGEMAVRGALGASRARIVAQLFAEALVLAGVATAVGLAGAAGGLRWVIGALEAGDNVLEFWFSRSLSATTVTWAVALAVVGAVVAGVLPGIKVTAGRAQGTLQRLAGRGSGAHMGRLWSAIIVTQVAFTVMLVPIVLIVGLGTWRIRSADPGLPAGEYLAATLEMDGVEAFDSYAGLMASEEFLARYTAAYRELDRRLAEEAEVAGVTVATQIPGAWHGRRAVELEGVAEPLDERDRRAQLATVAPDFFEVMGTPVRAGRGFADADAGADPGADAMADPGPRVVVVNESFVETFLGGRNAIGQRVRYAQRGPGEPEEAQAWHEIVGVVRDVAMTIDPDMPHNAGIYFPLSAGTSYPVRMAVRVQGDPLAFLGRLRQLSAGVDPALRLDRPIPLDQAAHDVLVAYDSWFRVIAVGGAIALLLTLAGIYAILSFTVSRRTREIGVRVALGADRRQVVRAILSRMARQVGLGVGLGVVLFVLFGLVGTEGEWRPGLRDVALLAGYVVVMTGVCMLACVVPTRRALSVVPTEALAAEG